MNRCRSREWVPGYFWGRQKKIDWHRPMGSIWRGATTTAADITIDHLPPSITRLLRLNCRLDLIHPVCLRMTASRRIRNACNNDNNDNNDDNYNINNYNSNNECCLWIFLVRTQHTLSQSVLRPENGKFPLPSTHERPMYLLQVHMYAVHYISVMHRHVHTSTRKCILVLTYTYMIHSQFLIPIFVRP